MSTIISITVNETFRAIFVGGGLQKCTYEECANLGLNPNPNPSGEICLPQDGGESTRRHIIKSQEEALRLLRY